MWVQAMRGDGGSMVMSGSGERVVFVFDQPGDEVLWSGGTIARLRSDGGQVAVLFRTAGTTSGPGDGGVDAAMDVLDVRDWRVLHAAPDAADGGDRLDDVIGEVVERLKATAVVIGSPGDALESAAVRVAEDAGIPVFFAAPMSDPRAGRHTAIDVHDHREPKLEALEAYPGRWSVAEGVVTLPDGTRIAVTGSENYLRPNEPHPGAARERPAPLARLGSVVAAFAAGIGFGVLGTIAHQATVMLGAATLPIGLILALCGATALLVGARLISGDRLVVLGCALGLLGTIFVLSLRSAGGSVLIPSGLPGTLWTVAPALIAAVVLGWPKLPARR